MSYLFPDIQNDFESYQKLISFYDKNKDRCFDTIDIAISGWFSANSCSMLGAILKTLQNNVNTINVNVGKAESILERNGFLSFFGQKKIPDFNNTAIAYKVLSVEDDRYFNSYVLREFLSKPDLPKMTNALKKKIAESIYEIFINAKMHSGTDKIFTCGQFFPKNHKIEFMITDLGIGIKNVVNNRFGADLSAIHAIKWAVKNRNTTKRVSGGIGFSILQEFIKKNEGKIQIVSDNGFWELNVDGIKTAIFSDRFPGTMVNISVRTDDINQYSLINEPIDDIF